MNYTEKELAEIFSLKVENVRFEFATTKTRHGKKGKKIIQSGGAFFVLKFANGKKMTLAALVRLANEMEDRPDSKAARELEPFCRSLISRAAINRTKRDLLKALSLPVSDELNNACKEEEKKSEERRKKSIEKILGIIEKGREKYIRDQGKRAREKAGNRFDGWNEIYNSGK